MSERVHLPESVEETIERICLEKKQGPLKNYARKMLALIGEDAAVDILSKVLAAVEITSFGGYVSHLVKKNFPIQAASVLGAYDSTQASPETQKTWSPSSVSSPFNSPQPKSSDGNMQSPESRVSGCWTKSASSKLHNSSPRNINRKLAFENGVPENRSPGVRNMSFSSEPKESEKPIPASPVLMILRKLEFRRLFLVHSYLWRQKLEDVIDEDAANEILKMKDVPMTVFEKEIWNKYGSCFCDESDRSMVVLSLSLFNEALKMNLELLYDKLLDCIALGICVQRIFEDENLLLYLHFPPKIRSYLYLDWDCGKTHLYYCHIDGDGSYYFTGPYLNRASTHLQRMVGDNNVLIVKFPEDDIGTISSKEIILGLRRYEFLVFKDEQKRAKKNSMVQDSKSISSIKCYFVRVGPDGEGDTHFLARMTTIRQIRSLFMHIHMVSSIRKYNARLSLILSKTVKLKVDLSVVFVEEIDDIPFLDEKGSRVYDKDGKLLIHTDGTGYISEDLAIRCQKDFLAAKHSKDSSFEIFDDFVEFNDSVLQNRGAGTMSRDTALLIQCRIFYNGSALKGTLLVNKKLDPGTIQIRRSMIKVERDPNFPVDETFNSLEIVKISHRPGRTSLSKNLIALLSYGGVPQEFFLNLLANTLEETQNVYSQRRQALRAACNHEGLDFGSVAKRMILSGVPLNEPYLRHCLSQLEKGEKNKLKDGKIPIDDSFYLMGTADPTPNGVLKNDEVCVILESGQISGKVLVYRNPGMHFGDVHVMKAVYVKELEEFVGNAKYGIFFSTKGSSSAAYEMANGDFDGDLYFVSRHPELLKYYRKCPPWSRIYHSEPRNRTPKGLSDEALQNELFKLFKEARTSSFDMAKACHSWLAYMDKLLTTEDADEKESLKEKMNQLTDIYYDALDAPKSGKVVKIPKDLVSKEYPHYMERPNSYNSSSILGQIYDRVEAFKNEGVPKQEIWKLPCFDDPIPEVYMDMWKSRYDNYRREMAAVLKSSDETRNEAANDVIIKYRKLLYNEPETEESNKALEMEESTKGTQIIYEEARAIYHVVYDYAISNDHDIGKCNFVWRVAGDALCNWFAWNLTGPRDKPLVVVPSILRELLN